MAAGTTRGAGSACAQVGCRGGRAGVGDRAHDCGLGTSGTFFQVIPAHLGGRGWAAEAELSQAGAP